MSVMILKSKATIKREMEDMEGDDKIQGDSFQAKIARMLIVAVEESEKPQH